jgi:hypothetical protein
MIITLTGGGRTLFLEVSLVSVCLLTKSGDVLM